MLAAAMPCPRRQFLTLVTIPALGGAVPGAVATLRMVSETLPPYVLPEDHPLGEGIDVDIARQALGAQGGLPIRLERLPWRRALALLESGEADLAPGVRRTAERERFLAFSQPYGSVVRHRAYSAREVRFSVRRSADLAQWHVGLVQGYAYPENLLAALGARVSRLPDEPALLRVAAAGRVDVALVTDLRARWAVQQLGLQQALRLHPFEFAEGHRTQMAFSRKSGPAMAALALMNRGLAQLERGGWQRFEQPYLQPLPA
jgi:ABC-type amino acid transport substrate-binding protein